MLKPCRHSLAPTPKGWHAWSYELYSKKQVFSATCKYEDAEEGP